MNRDVPYQMGSMGEAPDDITWHDAWDADDVIADLEKLANRYMRSGDYETCGLLKMVISYIEEKEDG